MSKDRLPFTTSHYSIAEYWRDKWITEDGRVISDAEYSGVMANKIAVFYDMGEPECWMCGKIISPSSIAHYDEKLEAMDVKGIWSSKGVTSVLQRCHIVPRSLGGSDEPDNLFLLCKRCHLLTPDYTNPSYFIRYVYNSIVSGRFILGQDIGATKDAFMMLQPDDIVLEIIKDHNFDWDSLIHMDTECMGIHSGVAGATLAAGIIDNIKNTDEYRSRVAKIIGKYIPV